MVEFVGAARLHVVYGAPTDLHDQLVTGAVQIDAIAGAVVVSDLHGVQLYPLDELDRLLERRANGEDVLAAILRHPNATLLTPGALAEEPAVVIEDGIVNGAFLEKRRRRRRTRAAAEPSPF
jgi:hypothetical protein